MKNVSCVLFPAYEKALKGNILLFKSLNDWVTSAALSAGVEKIFCREEVTGDTLGCKDILVLSERCPLISKEIIEESYVLHITSQFPITAICSAEHDEICAAFIRSDILKTEDFELTQVQALLEELNARGGKSGIYVADEGEELFSIHSARDLYFANEAARTAVINRAMENGAVIMCDSGIIISPDCEIGEGSVILPGTIIRNGSCIGEGCTIGPNSLIDSSEIADNCVINATQITRSTVDEGTTIGPFTQLRPDSHIGKNVKIGDFVEIKNSTIGDKTSVAHLTYVGDSDVGRKVNFGCGTVTVNYDGKNKFRTTIGDYAFIGCNSNLVAPVKIGDNAFTAAGSTVTHDVPDDSLYISREKDEKIIEGWVNEKLGHRRWEE